MPERFARYATLWVTAFLVGILLALVPALWSYLSRNRWGVALAVAGASAIVMLDVATEEG